ncbi:MAG: M20/M25/M40 family metallo-hydrolase [Sandaracinaceae bacterium]|nr:M20/M25/M40 family metallo-hydrolase [Sandaracinaceae bacterium]
MRRAARGLLVALALGSCGTPEAAAPEPPDPTPAAAEPAPLTDTYRAPVGRIVEASEDADYAWTWLEALCGDIGHRLSGSPSLERAVDWSATELDAIEGVRVERQPVQVGVWIRGEESLELVGDDAPLAMVGLGGSVGTGEEGVEGEVVVLSSLDEVEPRASELAGKIVLFDQAMPDYDPDTYETGYGETVGIRTRGPAQAGARGALAVLVRSVTADRDSPPHTGATRYDDEGPRVPGAAVSVPVAERLHRLVDEGAHPRVRLRMQAHTEEATATSHNVIAELRGRELPDEIVVFGGHIDSWDVGQGCHDDGAGVVTAMAALRVLVELGLTPRRTIRAILWTNEENGLAGARAYEAEHWGDGLHVAGIESDIGAAPVIALDLHTEDVRRQDALAQLGAIVTLLEPTGLREARAGHGGADVSPLEDHGTPTVGLLHDPAHYFDLHHTAADTIETVDRDAFLQGVAVMAATVYVLADMEPRLSNPR